MKALNLTLGHVLRLLVAVGLCLMATAASTLASPNCGQRSEIIAILAERYGETPRGIGLAANQSMLEIYASSATGTWTATATSAGGTTCLIASGEGWQDIAPTVVLPGTEG